MNNLELKIQILENKIKDLFAKDNSGHNIDHLKRTMTNALLLQKQEGGDIEVVAISAFLHDIHRIMTEDQRNFVSPKDSIPKVKQLLEFISLTKEQKEHICSAIEHHEEYSFGGGKVTVKDIESKILQDADNLDAAGAIGIMRTILFSNAHGIPLYDENYPLSQQEYAEGGKFDPSNLHHCVNKLSRLHETMNTETGKKLCKQRCRFIDDFVKQCLNELMGNI